MSSAQLLVGVLFSNGLLLFSNFVLDFVLEHKGNPFENKTATNNWAELIRFGDVSWNCWFETRGFECFSSKKKHI